MEWIDLVLTALGLLLVLEGMIPFLNPAKFRLAMAMIYKLSDSTLRTAGAVAMVAGVVLLYLV